MVTDLRPADALDELLLGEVAEAVACVDIRGRAVIRHCHALLYRDSPCKRELEGENDRSPSSKPAGVHGVLALERARAAEGAAVAVRAWGEYPGATFGKQAPNMTGHPVYKWLSCAAKWQSDMPLRAPWSLAGVTAPLSRLGGTGPLSQGVQARRKILITRHTNGMEVRKKRPRGGQEEAQGVQVRPLNPHIYVSLSRASRRP